MAFNRIEIPKKSTAGFKLKMFRMRGSPWRMMISIPSTRFPRMLGKAEFVEAFLGDGEDAGKLMLKPAEAGIKVSALKYCFVIRLPALDQFPEGALECDEPEHEVVEAAGGGNALVITLPEWAVNRARAAEILAARADNAADAARERIEDAGDAPGGIDFDGAPGGTEAVHCVIVAAAGAKRSTALRVSAIADAAGISKSGVLNAVAWLSSKNIVQRQSGAGPAQPDLYTVVRA